MRRGSILAGGVLALFVVAQSASAASSAYLIKDIWPGDDSNADLLMAAGNVVYFQADDGVHGRELWRTDGTETGTFMVVDGLPGSKSANPEPIGSVGNVMYFNGKDSIHGHELWRTTGNGTGAKLVKNITPGKDSTDFGEAIAYGNRLLLTAAGYLYVTDGSSAGTKPIGPGGRFYVQMGAYVYYLVGNNLDASVWRTDGTAAGTKQVGWTPGSVTYIAATSDRLYMITNSDEGNTGAPELWVTNGTKAGTLKLTTDGTLGKASRLAVVGDKVAFFDRIDGGDRIWRSNGTPAGTKIMSALPGSAAQIYGEGGAAYVPVDMGDGTEQIWVSWGTIAGTHSIATITSTYTTEEWATLGSTVYFQSYDAYGSNTWVLWQTDGTTSGTAVATSGGPADGYPWEVTAAGDKLIFSADDGVTGREIWAYQP
jgi:ELWxxDGT repeat protein